MPERSLKAGSAGVCAITEKQARENTNRTVAAARVTEPIMHAKLAITARLESIRENGNDGVVGESGVAMLAVFDVGHAAAAIAFDGPGTIDGDGGAAEAVHDAWVDGDDIAGAAESIAGAESVADGNPFHASAKTEGKMANCGNTVRKAAAEKILVCDGHDGFTGA